MERSYLRIAKRREGRVLLFFILIIVIMWALWVIVISAKGALPFLLIVGLANALGAWYLWMEWRTITLARRMDRELKDVELDRSLATSRRGRHPRHGGSTRWPPRDEEEAIAEPRAWPT